MIPWIMVLTLLGMILLFAEILMPGFGLFGILGVGSLLGSLVLTYYLFGMGAFLILLGAVVLLFFGMIAFAKKSGLYNKVILKDRLTEKDFDESVLHGLLGQIGQTQTTLKPFGVAVFEGKTVDVCSQGDFIDRGKTVQIIQITGKTVVVKRCEKKDE